MAALSRPVAGTISTTLIVALPGSPRAVRECLDTLLANGLMFHAIDLNRGGTGKAVHQAMAKGASGPELAGVVSSTQTHHHSHSHHHHDHGHGHHAPKPRTVLSNDPSQPGVSILV
jgi:gephyrin